MEEAKRFETIVEIEEVVACGANEKVVDISMPTTIFEHSEDEVTDEFVVECIEEIIDVPTSITILSNNECNEDVVEASEDLPSNEDQSNKENMEDELCFNFTNDNKSYFVFVNAQDHEYSFHEDTYVLFPQLLKMIYEDEFVPRANMPDLNKTKIRGRIFLRNGGMMRIHQVQNLSFKDETHCG